jgi:dipeptidyl aminopeptidase/acylaminoacyl peptidase
VLLIQGDDDPNVPFSQTVDLAQRLRANHVYFEQLVFPDEAHDMLLWRNWVGGYQATAEFFNRMLKPKAAAGR